MHYWYCFGCFSLKIPKAWKVRAQLKTTSFEKITTDVTIETY